MITCFSHRSAYYLGWLPSIGQGENEQCAFDIWGIGREGGGGGGGVASQSSLD